MGKTTSKKRKNLWDNFPLRRRRRPYKRDSLRIFNSRAYLNSLSFEVFAKLHSARNVDIITEDGKISVASIRI